MKAQWGSSVGCGNLAKFTPQLQLLVPCTEICSGHKLLCEDIEATGATPESATGIGDGEPKGGAWREKENCR